ncbi:MAG: hypothetical protein AB7F35_06400 [Acetobacteraceae bacterium]
MPAFEQVIRLQLVKYSPEEARRRHIALARRGLAEFMARQTVKPMVSLEVDHHQAASEDQVRPFGVIVYRFSRMREVVSFALRECERLSPALSGRYRKSWFVLAGRREIMLDQIPDDGPVTVTNDQPYHRKIHVGAKGYARYANPGIVEKVRQLVRRRYGAIVSADITFIRLSDGYRLRRPRRREAELSYPALILTGKF